MNERTNSTLHRDAGNGNCFFFDFLGRRWFISRVSETGIAFAVELSRDDLERWRDRLAGAIEAGDKWTSRLVVDLEVDHHPGDPDLVLLRVRIRA